MHSNIYGIGLGLIFTNQGGPTRKIQMPFSPLVLASFSHKERDNSQAIIQSKETSKHNSLFEN